MQTLFQGLATDEFTFDVQIGNMGHERQQDFKITQSGETIFKIFKKRLSLVKGSAYLFYGWLDMVVM